MILKTDEYFTNVKLNILDYLIDKNSVKYTNDIKSKWYVYDNQIQTAKEIILNFYNKYNRWILLFAEMQSGKSGTFFSIPYIIARNKSLIKELNIDMFDDEINVYLITGMNEKELIQQFEYDIVSFTGMDIKKNIFHNSEMQKFISKDENYWSIDDKKIINRMRKNSLILIDESHYGSDKNQILNTFLNKILNVSVNDETSLYNNNIYVVSISATPMSEYITDVLYDKRKTVALKNSQNYYGILDMFKNTKIKQSFNLNTDDGINELLNTINSYDKNGYILIRSTTNQQNEIIAQINKNYNNIKHIEYDQYSKSRILNNIGINELISNIPNDKTIIFLKGLLRAGKRLDTSNIIMVHDTNNSNTDTTVQSLLGRLCGYNKNKNINVYCDLKAAIKYKLWIENNYEISFIPNKCKNVLSDNKLKITTFIQPKSFNIFDENIYDIIDKDKKTLIDKINILRSLKCNEIDDILNCDNYIVSTFIKVKKNNESSSYQKYYLDVLKYNTYYGNYKPKPNELNKIVICLTYNLDEKILLITFGKIIQNNILVSENSMYYQN